MKIAIFRISGGKWHILRKREEQPSSPLFIYFRACERIKNAYIDGGKLIIRTHTGANTTVEVKFIDSDALNNKSHMFCKLCMRHIDDVDSFVNTSDATQLGIEPYNSNEPLETIEISHHNKYCPICEFEKRLYTIVVNNNKIEVCSTCLESATKACAHIPEGVVLTIKRQ